MPDKEFDWELVYGTEMQATVYQSGVLKFEGQTGDYRIRAWIGVKGFADDPIILSQQFDCLEEWDRVRVLKLTANVATWSNDDA